ncbi:MAG: hypothetical protein MRY59_10380 [Aquisalinus sp.]|nr:hypothetical protein [Aquisalinus sp.]
MAKYAHLHSWGTKCGIALGQGDFQVILTDSAGMKINIVKIFDSYKVNIVRDERKVKTAFIGDEQSASSQPMAERKARGLRKKLFRKLRPTYLSLEKACNNGHWEKAHQIIESETKLLHSVHQLPITEQEALLTMLQQDGLRMFNSEGYRSWVRGNTAVFFGFDAKDQVWESQDDKDYSENFPAQAPIIDDEGLLNSEHKLEVERSFGRMARDKYEWMGVIHYFNSLGELADKETQEGVQQINRRVGEHDSSYTRNVAIRNAEGALMRIANEKVSQQSNLDRYEVRVTSCILTGTDYFMPTDYTDA